ncbi:hypothetical protein HAX54_038121 [Datura stramonium]|uniref:Uncharacterized protein n=1 Tax=Datura stramonium TaxID=4076 RepID=A0ABS8VMR6_DATST|nr:hypothetical protein [Datura stramonium]
MYHKILTRQKIILILGPERMKLPLFMEKITSRTNDADNDGGHSLGETIKILTVQQGEMMQFLERQDQELTQLKLSIENNMNSSTLTMLNAALVRGGPHLPSQMHQALRPDMKRAYGYRKWDCYFDLIATMRNIKEIRWSKPIQLDPS